MEENNNYKIEATFITHTGNPFANIKVESNNPYIIGGDFKYPITACVNGLKNAVEKDDITKHIKLITLGNSNNDNFDSIYKDIIDNTGVNVGVQNIVCDGTTKSIMIGIYDHIINSAIEGANYFFDLSFCDRYLKLTLILAAQELQKKSCTCFIIDTINDSNIVYDYGTNVLDESNTPMIPITNLLSDIGLI